MVIYKAHLKEINPIGLEFFTFYIEKSKRGTRINKDTKIFKVKPIKEVPRYGYMGYEFEVLEVFGKPKIGSYKLEYFINNLHACSANYLYTTFEEAVKGYDYHIQQIIENPKCNSKELELLNKMLINKKTEKEQALNWYKNLDNLHKNYLTILGFNDA